MSDRPLGVGIVGFGWMGKTHAYAYQNIPYHYETPPAPTRLVGVCVRRAETIDEAVGLGGFEFGTTSFDDLLQRDDIDIINVCTPNDLHRDEVIAALEAGKHVYCDKPLAVDYEECRQIVEAADRCDANLVTQVALQYRFYPCTMRAKQLVEAGRLGRISSFRACYLHASLVDSDKPAGWRLRPGKGGGALNDMGCHLLDLLGHLVGPFDRVVTDCLTQTPRRTDPTTGQTIDIETDDMAAMLLRTRAGAMGTAEVSKLATGAQDELRIEIHGDKGALRFNLVDPNWLEFYDMQDPADPIGGVRGFRHIETIGNYPPPAGNMVRGKLNIGWLAAHIACLQNFLAAIAGSARPHPTFEDAAELQRVIDAAYSSSRTGEWVTL